MARQVNTVWNFCNETSSRAVRERHKFLSGFDLQKLTDGFSKCDGVTIGSATTQQVCEEYATRRRQFKRTRLAWRVSNPQSAKRSLGWVPFKSRAVRYKAGQIHFCGLHISLWDSYGLAQFELRSGSFSEDARGRWYLNVQVKLNVAASEGVAALGVDLGLKTAATCSDGSELASGVYRRHEAALAVAQRARKKGRARAITPRSAIRAKTRCTSSAPNLWRKTGPSSWGMFKPRRWSKPRWPSPRSTRAGRCSRQCWNTRAMGPVLSLMRSTRPIQPRLVRAAGPFPPAVRKVEQVLE